MAITDRALFINSAKKLCNCFGLRTYAAARRARLGHCEFKVNAILTGDCGAPITLTAGYERSRSISPIADARSANELMSRSGCNVAMGTSL